jgi:myo-inositol-1(or 4)-monophosphatase
MELDKLLITAKEAALIGGQVLKENFGKVRSEEIEEKAPKDFVSFVDRTAEERIREYLKAKFPQFSILGEEGGLEEKGNLLWVIDPLDGTKNFLAGFPIFGVSVALVDAEKDFQPLVGAVYLPYGDGLYYASLGGGAFKNGKPIKVNSAKNELKKCFFCYGFPSRAQRDLNLYCRIMLSIFSKVASLRRPGAAAVDLAYVAEGIFDGTFEFELKLWDVAAGSLIVREAGGKVAWLNFNPDNWRLDIVASVPQFFDEIKAEVEKVLFRT